MPEDHSYLLCLSYPFTAMKVVLLLGCIAFATLFRDSQSCDECNKCWNYKQCKIPENPWDKRRFYVVMVSQVQHNTFWGDDQSCGVFNKCQKSGCGCLGIDVSWGKGRKFSGQFIAYDRTNGRQYMRRFYAHLTGNDGFADVTFFVTNQAYWVVPKTVVEKVTCDECGRVSISTYTVPEAQVITNTVSFQVRAIVIVYKVKFRILVFCNGLRGIVDNKPFAMVIGTMPKPSKKTWEKINKMLRHYNFEPRNMMFLSQDSCIYPPFDWCNSWVGPPNPDCGDICVVDK